MSTKSSTIVFVVLAVLSAGCDVQFSTVTAPTDPPVLITATFAAPPTQTPTDTPLPPPPTPTAAPVEGVTTTQVNVRAGPSTTGSVLGLIPANTKVEITGKDPGESWWQINYPQGVDGKGWITAQYVSIATKPEVPTIGGKPTPTETPSGEVAVIQQQINVRSGPGTSFNSLGTLNPQEAVKLTGKDSNGAWLQIDFPAGPEGKGWINAAFVQTQGVDLNGLPIVAETGLVVGTGTPTAIPLTVTPTLVPAWEDGDFPGGPIISVIFEPTGTRSLMYNGDISSPQGDTEDWIAFKPYGAFVYISMTCQGNNSVKTDLVENSLPTGTYINCGDPLKKISVKPGSNYLIHIQATPATGGLQYTSYGITIKTEP
ncbi:MAG: SH3 domain-containing protein [Chloroflexota bacterium]|nr:SH3 domain-containing protein [Anaerolineales bacterium]